MKARNLYWLGGLGGTMIMSSSNPARAEYEGLVALYERHDGNGHDIYRVYAQFTNAMDGVVFCGGNAANPINIQTRNAEDTGLGTNFYNPGGGTGNGPPFSDLTINGTYVTIGVSNVNQLPSYFGSSTPGPQFSPGFPNFIGGTNNFVNINMGWFTTGFQTWGTGAYINEGNDTALRVMIMQLAVNTNEQVRGTLNIGVVDGVNNGQLIVGQTFHGVPGPGGLGLLGLSGVIGARRRKR